MNYNFSKKNFGNLQANFKTVIGLEVHVQLKTKSKMFCGCTNNDDTIGDMRYANTRVCPVCLGLPGVLPVANIQAIEWTLKTGLALNCQLADFSRFNRKHYFYPDLPKGYQISQYDMPFARQGELEIRNQKSEIRKIRITRVHLEEDAGKLLHIAGSVSQIAENDKPYAISDKQGYTLVDLNRAGTPLMEIVTEPDISSAGEAKIFMQELRSILRYLNVSDANMEKGHLRCDANISISHIADRRSQQTNHDRPYAISDKLGTPVEIKNLNSFRMVERALLYEEKRQKELLENPPAGGGEVVKETRGWNDEKGETYSQRSKELAQDYRYFPEPDLPPFELKNVDLEKIKSEIPELPAEKRHRYVENFKLTPQDAAILAIDKDMAKYFEKVAAEVNPKLVANWVINVLKNDGILKVSSENLIEMLKLLEKNEISGKIAKEVLTEMIASGKSAKNIINEKGLKQMGDEFEIMPIIEKVIAENSEVVKSVKAGKTQAIGFLVGIVMQETKGQANPQMVNKLLKEVIEKG